MANRDLPPGMREQLELGTAFGGMQNVWERGFRAVLDDAVSQALAGLAWRGRGQSQQ